MSTADLGSFDVPFIADPDLPERFRRGPQCARHYDVLRCRPDSVGLVGYIGRAALAAWYRARVPE